MWQYNVIIPFLRNETKQPFLLYETPHPFRRNERMVLKRFVAEKRSQNDSSLNKTMKNDLRPFAAPSRPVAAAPSRRCCYSFAPCTSLAACERQKQRILPEAKGIRRAPNRICRPRNHLFTIQSFFYRSARRQCLLYNCFSSVLPEGS